MKRELFAISFLIWGTVGSADQGFPVPIGAPDNRRVVARLEAVLPPSLNNDYVGKTEKGRYCTLKTASTGYEYLASIQQAIPNTPWSFGKPTMMTTAASFGLTMNVNPMKVTKFSENERFLEVTYEQILPRSNVNLQELTGGTIRIEKTELGRPLRVEITQRTFDTWNDFVFERRISCGN